MANKYLIHGATYCGDGTTSAEAASAGAAGAWNNINVFEGTAPAYGSLAAGDTVYIRSKDSSGSNITRTLSANINLGSSAATLTSPITWIIDGGSIWSGVNDVITYTASTSWSSTQRDYNPIVAEVQDALVFENTSTNPLNWDHFLCKAYAKNLKFSAPNKTGFYSLRIKVYQGGLLDSPHISYIRVGTVTNEGLIYPQAGADVVIVNPDIELTGNYQDAGGVFCYLAASSGAPQITVIGGSVSGLGTGSGSVLVSLEGSSANYPLNFVGIGFQVPRTMSPFAARGGDTYRTTAKVTLTACEVDGIGGHYDAGWGWATSRTDNNPPTLSAEIPDSVGTLFSLRCYPKAASEAEPMLLTSAKVFTDTAATKTITQELLIANTITATQRDVWMDVSYIDDTTGLPKHISTRVMSGGSLTSSSAGWSATTWGMIGFNKVKLEATTPTSIKKDTTIVVSFFVSKPSATDQDIYFFDPDFSLS